MRRWMRGLAAAVVFGALPAAADESSAEAKDRKHEEQIRERMEEREDEKATGVGENTQKGADQVGDAARVGGAKAARKYHEGVDEGKKATNKAAEKVEEKTE